MADNSKSSRSAGFRRWKSNIHLLVLSLLAFTGALRAQEPAVSLKVDLVAWGNEIKGLSFRPGDAKGGVTALSFRYSQPVPYSGPVLMEIYKSADDHPVQEAKMSEDDKAHQLMPLMPEDERPEAGAKVPVKKGLALELEKRRKKAPTLVALAALPAGGCNRATILLAPADEGTFTAYVIEDDPTKLPAGKLRIHNLSPFEIMVRCNGVEEKKLKTKESFIAPSQNQQLIYELAYKDGDDWKVQENNIIPVRSSEQAHMMILKSSNCFFLSTDGSAGGFLQIVTLRRGAAN